jgi:ribonucleoside-triphosphate reductase
MACGVAKTYSKKYHDLLLISLVLHGGETCEECARKTLTRLRDKGYIPSLENEKYMSYEMEALSKAGCDAKTVEDAQKFARTRAEEATERATYQAMESLIHNLNTMHSRAGAQTPFSSINYGMDTSPEGRMAVKCALLATEAGLGGGETPIFPIQIFRVKAGVNFNPGDPNYDLFQLSCRVSSKRLFPNFSFIDAPFNARYYKPGRPETEIAYMGCRTRVIGNAHDPSREISNGRGNLSFTTMFRSTTT